MQGRADARVLDTYEPERVAFARRLVAIAPVDKRIRNSSPIKDIGEAETGQLVLANHGDLGEVRGSEAVLAVHREPVYRTASGRGRGGRALRGRTRAR